MTTLHNSRVSVCLALIVFLGFWSFSELSGSPSQFTEASEVQRSEVLDQYYDEIRDLPFNYRNVGSVLEALGFLHLSEEFPPPDFQVVANVAYRDATGRTLGEIDLMVIDLSENRVLAVYEVKLTRSPVNAGRTARRQLRRLETALGSNEFFVFENAFPNIPINADLFDSGTQYLLLGGRETQEFDWNRSLDLTRDEGDQLQNRLLKR